MDLICRTCLAYEDELEPLFSKKLVDTDYNEITAMILLCTGLEISEDDKFSNTICAQCIESIIAAFKYRTKVWNSNTVLLETTKMLEDVTGDNIEFEKPDGFIEPKLEYIDIDNIESDLLPSDRPHIKNETNYFQHGSEDNRDGYIPYNQDGYKNIEKYCRVTPSSLSPIADEQNYIEIGPDDKFNIAKLTAKIPDPKNYTNMDKYIRVADKATTMRPYSCTICNQTYEIVGPLRKHMLLNHNIRVMKAFRCITCSKTFVSERYFRRHLKEAHQPVSMNQNHVCELCGKAFKYASSLLDHRNRHNGVKPFKCEICDFRTVALSEIKVHLRSHTGEKPFICHICGVGYKSSSHRSAHLKEAHSDGRPYECVICAKTYKSRRVYMSHKQIHNPNQHIKCDICDKEFNYRKNLKVHMRQHGEKTFKCTVCEKAFYQKQNCQTHMKKIHNVKM